MIKFLIQRPIAVLMAFTACFIVGLITYHTLPVSLLPDIAIPEITVQITSANTSARELENTIVKPIRQQLLQVARLQDMKSETRDGAGIIRLSFDFGINTDLAFIEVNEKIDAAMNYLPKDADRPKVIKASATDIPVFYLNLTLKGGEGGEAPQPGFHAEANQTAFLDLCDFAESVIKRRIEQLPEVAMVDVTGLVDRQLQIVPDMDKMALLNLSIEDIETVLSQNNVEPGSMIVRDGYYEYNIRFATLLRTVEDVENIYLDKDGRIMQLKDFCKVGIVPAQERGLSVVNGKRAVTLAIIKHADENMDRMKEALSGTMDYFARVYPDIDFTISRNQTELLDYTIANLKENLTLGFIFICIIAVLFLGDVKSPFIIGLSMVVSIVICFMFFYLFKMSLNIISLSGLILALGMMIDSSIIVTENISQYRERGYSLKRACVVGTSEVITPMLSSTLTTIAVFVPLVFMSGIAGAIFFDQAFSVTVGLIISYFTGIMLLPVLYYLVYRTGMRKSRFLSLKINNPFKEHTLDGWYDRGVDWVFNHKLLCVVFCLVSIPLCVFMFFFIDKARMPEIDQNELMVRIEWNENIHIDENRGRINTLFGVFASKVVEQSAFIGQQDFLLNRDQELSSSEVELYLKTASPEEVAPLQREIYEKVKQAYPSAVISFSPPESFFEKLFVTGEADVVAELYPRNKESALQADHLRKLETEYGAATGLTPTGVAFENQLNIHINRERLLLYNVSYNELQRMLKTAFKENEVAMLHAFQQYLPISIAGEEKTVNRILQETLIQTLPDKYGKVNYIPLRELITITPAEDLKSIIAGRNGEYIPFQFYQVRNAEALIGKVKTVTEKTGQWEVNFSGSFFSNQKMLNELVVILFVSILLMYFILAAQFESFLQPLIVLMEIPIDVAFALILLWIFGHTLNLMSAIGLIVTCGIIINDSILKLDAINELRKTGVPLIEAIHEAGRRRLRPIIMTSLTTIFAMVPLLFSFDMGSELQKPLSIAMIGTMAIGTLVSLFIIPLIYWFIYRKNSPQSNTESHGIKS